MELFKIDIIYPFTNSLYTEDEELDELDRIRAQVLKTKDDDYEMQRTAARKTSQETSKARVKNWPNTMEATRLKREEDRIKRLEDEEVSAGNYENLNFRSNADASMQKKKPIKRSSGEIR